MAVNANLRIVPNIPVIEGRALNGLKKDSSIVITKADKGNVMVILDRSEYMEKVNLLFHFGPYSRITMDPIKDLLKNSIGQLDTFLLNKNKATDLPRIRQKLGRVSGFKSPKLFCLRRVHKDDVLFRPVVCSIGSVTNDLAKWLTLILKPQ